MYVVWIDVQSLIPLRLHRNFDVNHNEFKKVEEKRNSAKTTGILTLTNGKEDDKIEALKRKKTFN